MLIVIFVCFLRAGPAHRPTAPRTRSSAIFSTESWLRAIRGLTSRIAGRQEDDTFAVALVEIEDALSRRSSKSTSYAYTVFVPSVLTRSRAIYILPRERVHQVDVSFARAAAVITKRAREHGICVRQ
jgi:hypothetical protein